MNREATAIFEFLKNAILEVKDVDESDIAPETSLQSLALESLDYVDIQVNIRKTYDVEITSDQFASGMMSTLGDLADHILNAARTTAASE